MDPSIISFPFKYNFCIILNTECEFRIDREKFTQNEEISLHLNFQGTNFERHFLNGIVAEIKNSGRNFKSPNFIRYSLQMQPITIIQPFENPKSLEHVVAIN